LFAQNNPKSKEWNNIAQHYKSGEIHKDEILIAERKLKLAVVKKFEEYGLAHSLHKMHKTKAIANKKAWDHDTTHCEFWSCKSYIFFNEMPPSMVDKQLGTTLSFVAKPFSQRLLKSLLATLEMPISHSGMSLQLYHEITLSLLDCCTVCACFFPHYNDPPKWSLSVKDVDKLYFIIYNSYLRVNTAVTTETRHFLTGYFLFSNLVCQDSNSSLKVKLLSFELSINQQCWYVMYFTHCHDPSQYSRNSNEMRMCSVFDLLLANEAVEDPLNVFYCLKVISESS